MGSHLANWLGSDYLVLGFAFHGGKYNAVRTSSTGVRSLGDNDAVESYPGSVEYVFHRTGMPQFILDLRLAKPANAGAWLLGEVESREIGALAIDGFSIRNALTKEYDALIFFDQTTASTLLP